MRAALRAAASLVMLAGPCVVALIQLLIQLWHTVRTPAAEIGTRAPDEIRIVAEDNAAVTERTRLLRLVGGAHTLHVGAPPISALSVQQLRAVLAHEFGHYSGHHTRLAAVAYRGRVAVPSSAGTSWLRHLRLTQPGGTILYPLRMNISQDPEIPRYIEAADAY